MHWSEKLKELGACDESIEWAKAQPSAAVAWASCERIEWMTWLMRQLARGGNGSHCHRQATLLACLFSRTATNMIPSPEREGVESILAQVEKWAWGEHQSTREDRAELRQRASDLRSTLWRKYSVYAYSCGEAAAAACDASYAAYAAAQLAANAAEAAYADGAGAYSAAYATSQAPVWFRAIRDPLRCLCDLLRSAIECPEL